MATIAGMISSPNRLNPLRHPDARQDPPQRGARPRCCRSATSASPPTSRARRAVAAARDLHREQRRSLLRRLREEGTRRTLSAEVLTRRRTADFHHPRRALQKLAENAIVENLADLEPKHPKLRRKEENERARRAPGLAGAAERQNSRDDRRAQLSALASSIASRNPNGSRDPLSSPSPISPPSMRR